MQPTTRRQVIKTLASTMAVTMAGSALFETAHAEPAPGNVPPAASTPPSAPGIPILSGPYTLPPLPYAYSALEPYIDTETMELHHDKHHAAYVAKLNEAVASHPQLAAKPVEQLLREFSSVPSEIQTAVRNQGGGHANHSLFWKILAKNEGNPAPHGPLVKAIQDDLGGFDKLKEDFNKAALGVFGSGWVWVTIDSGKKLRLSAAPNQDSPWMSGQVPLFGLDVWEHSYYLKYRNRRVEYVHAFWNILNWDFVSTTYASSVA